MRLFAGTQFDIPPTCDRCGALEQDCKCPPLPPPKLDPQKQTARLMTEKRKRGKVVTLIKGLPAAGNDLPALLTKLKSRCGAGGTIKEDQLEIQGDHLETARSVLSEIGFRTKG
ncbi:translation initiation factor [Rosistilla oblonga]|uniref:translation initiation factor n=1 Tax=Rosistilla oblonga TaxID=2527990 RepID=UPI003A973973